MTVKRSQLRDPEKEKFPMMKEKIGGGGAQIVNDLKKESCDSLNRNAFPINEKGCSVMERRSDSGNSLPIEQIAASFRIWLVVHDTRR